MAENVNKGVLRSALPGFGSAAEMGRAALALVVILWLNPILLAYLVAFLVVGYVVRWLWRLRA
jgi:hypothetical protein